MADSCEPARPARLWPAVACCGLLGSFIHGILQARILEWVAISLSRVSSQPRSWTHASCIVGRFFTYWAMTLATWCEELTHWKRPWCWEGLKAGGEGDDRGWDGWMASPTQWTWLWASSRNWWWTEKPGMLQSMGLQRVRPDWVTELNYLLITYGKWKKMSHLENFS